MQSLIMSIMVVVLCLFVLFVSLVGSSMYTVSLWVVHNRPRRMNTLSVTTQ